MPDIRGKLKVKKDLGLAFPREGRATKWRGNLLRA
jgi:hypothetical protein